MTDETVRPPDLLGSVAKGLRVLEVVSATPRGLTVKQLARRCGMNPASMYHVVRTLTYEGYLIRAENGRFTTGLPVARRYRELVAAIRPAEPVRLELRRQAVLTGYTHCAAQFVADRIVVVAAADGLKSPPVDEVRPGMNGGNRITAWNLALLATVPSRNRPTFLGERGPQNTTMPHRVDALLQGGQRGGLFTEFGRFRPGMATAAVLASPRPPASPTALGCLLPGADLRRSTSAVQERLSAIAALVDQQ